MGVWILRLILFFICGISGYALGAEISSTPQMRLWGLVGGLFLAGLTLLMERGLKKVPFKNLLGSIIGLIIGMFIASFISNIFFYKSHQ